MEVVMMWNRERRVKGSALDLGRLLVITAAKTLVEYCV